MWITILSTQLFFIVTTSYASSLTSTRSLQDLTGVEACSSCQSPTHKCVGRTVQDENCDPCSSGQNFWPCNLSKECWCWDTTKIRDPGDEPSAEVACSGCGRDVDTELCVANQNSLIPVDTEECAKCMQGQSFWPCDDPNLCWCWDSTKAKKPPAPASGLSLAKDIDPNVLAPCEILTQDMFLRLAPNSTFPYTYDGLCNAIDDYNLHHTEKFAAMGTEEHIRAEIAGFLGNTAHESDDFEAAREYLACGDRKEVDGKVYCKPCNNDLYDWANNICSVSMVDQNSPYNSYCQPSFEPPEGCVCDTITQVEESGPLAGYVEASKVFYGRGAIQLSWNYNYIRASYALTGDAESFCRDPEQVALKPEYAWGSGIFFWMENEKEGSTCHKEVLKGDFGGTLNNINGGLECPAYKGGWHADAIKMRLNRYCHAASQLGMEAISSLDGCKGMKESYEECLLDGHCPYCEQYAGIDTTTLEFAVVEQPPESDTEIVVKLPESEPDADESTNARPVPGIPLEVKEEEPEGEPEPGTPLEVEEETVPGIPLEEEEAEEMATPAPAIPESSSISTTSPTSSTSDIVKVQSPNPTETAESSPPTATPTSGEPSASPLSKPTGEPTSAAPSYTPTTPQPTMGPCDGETCPGEMCRSVYGFCGSGPDHYCNDKAIWSPSCKENSKSPTPPPTNSITNEPTTSPMEKATPILDEVFAVTKQPVSSTIFEPSKSPSMPLLSDKETIYKPMGGKGGGKPKPSSVVITSSPSQSQATEPIVNAIPVSTPQPIEPDTVVEEIVVSTPQPTKKKTPQYEWSDDALDWVEVDHDTIPVLNTPSPVTPAPMMQQTSPAPTLRTTEKEYSPTDPEASYYCGLDWGHANVSCKIRCPSSKSDECPDGQKCFAFTSCVEQKRENESEKPSRRPTYPPLTNEPTTQANQYTTPVPILTSKTTNPTPAFETLEVETADGVLVQDDSKTDEGCTGTPCSFVGECRSQYGFCGLSFIYCNNLSSWTIKCGLSGSDEGGVFSCEEDTKKCPEGEHVYRNPNNDCEHFPCPSDKEEEVFHLPGLEAPSPAKFSGLPKPTLPTISNPTPFILPIVNKPPGGTIDKATSVYSDDTSTVEIVEIGENDTSTVEIGEKDNIIDEEDDDEPSNLVDESYEPDPFSSFSVEDWFVNSANLRRTIHLFTVIISMTMTIL